MKDQYLRSVYLRLAGVVMLAVVLALAANALLSHRSFERALAPRWPEGGHGRQLGPRAAAQGRGKRHRLPRPARRRRALCRDRCRDPRDHLFQRRRCQRAGVLHQRPASSAAITAYQRSPQVLAALSRPEAVPASVRVDSHYMVSLPVVSQGQPLGMVHLGVDVRFVDNLMLEMLYDVLVVLVVSLFFTLELLHFLAGARLEQGAGGAGRRLRPRRPRRLHRCPPPPRRGRVRQRDPHARGHADTRECSPTPRSDATSRPRAAPGARAPAGLSAAQARLQALGSRFRFGEGEVQPGHRSDGNLAKVRAPLFVFILAEELTRSFLPGYVQELLVPVPWLSPQLVVGLPIALFMLIVALGQPYFGVLTERWGNRRTMLTGAAIAAAGFLASSMAATVIDLLLWRSLCAVGYAMVFVSSQAFVLEHSNAHNRATNLATFVGAIMGGHGLRPVDRRHPGRQPGRGAGPSSSPPCWPWPRWPASVSCRSRRRPHWSASTAAAPSRRWARAPSTASTGCWSAWATPPGRCWPPCW
ncbi:MAG: MFS transporter [Rubrivivax sp.]|nr:MFS transporter [Rubrivivax sp.]